MYLCWYTSISIFTADVGRAQRQTGPEYVAKRVMKSCHFGRAVTERIFVSPYVMHHCSAGFGGNDEFGSGGGGGYASSGCQGAVWSGQWFVGVLGPSFGPFDLCVKYVKREVEFLTKELEVRDIDLHDYVSTAESQPTKYTNLYANSRFFNAQSATSGYKKLHTYTYTSASARTHTCVRAYKLCARA